MTEKDSLFLTIDQAVNAVCLDFHQYGPQMLLFCEIMPLISGGRTVVKEDIRKNGAWISVSGQKHMRWMQWAQLVDHLCASLKNADISPELLASVCARVFQARAYPEIDPGSGRQGIRIETGMERYHCRQCGRCCRVLDYRNELTEADVQTWREQGRTDILKWVGVFRGENGKTVYRIWMIPGTRKMADTCPFLKKIPSQNRWVCKIHQVKPAICRQYPVTRKHALMTGCPGFDNSGHG